MKEYIKVVPTALIIALVILFSAYVFFQNVIGKFCLRSENCFYEKFTNDCKSNLAGKFSDAKCECRILSCSMK